MFNLDFDENLLESQPLQQPIQSNIDGILTSISTQSNEPQSLEQNLKHSQKLLPPLCNARFKNLNIPIIPEENQEQNFPNRSNMASSMIDSNLSDQGFYLQDFEKLLEQVKEKETQLINQQRQTVQMLEKNNKEKETLRQCILWKEQELFRQKKKIQKQEKMIKKLENEQIFSNQQIASLSEKIKYLEFLQNNSRKQQDQEIVSSKSLLSNSGRFDQIRDQKIQELENEIYQSKQQLQEFKKTNENDKKQYEQQLRQQENEAQKQIEVFKNLAIKFQLQSQLEAFPISYSNAELEPKLLNQLAQLYEQNLQENDAKIAKLTKENKENQIQKQEKVNEIEKYKLKLMEWENQTQKLFDCIRNLDINLEYEVETLTNSTFNCKNEPISLNIFVEWFQKIFVEKYFSIEKEKKDQKIQELQREYENDKQQYKQQLTQWEVEGEKLFQILQDSGFCNSSNFKIDPMQLHNLAEFCQKVLSENNKKIEELTLQIQKNENRIKELLKVNESQNEEYKLQLMYWQNQTQRLKEKILSIDNELTDKIQEVNQANNKMQKLQKKNQELESQFQKKK